MLTDLFTPDTVLMPWKPGPRHDISGPVYIGITDFRSQSEADGRQVYELGLMLGETWPVMQGAVGLWLWGRPAEFRGGSISVWENESDMRRFVRWPTHAKIMRAWRGRISVGFHAWNAEVFDPAEALTRARDTIEQPHRPTAYR